MSKLKTGGQLLVDALLAQDADTAFCVPGESYLDVLNALYDQQQSVRVVSCRHEGAASFMAEAYGKLTGRPGICFVTRGPGATNASIGVHTAFQDSTPMVLFVGQVGRDMIEREAFQEIDYRRMFGQFTKWVAQIDDVSRVGEYVSRAFSVAMSGRPGPVVLALPEDMLTESTFPKEIGRADVPQIFPDPDALERMQALLRGAKKPLMILGGSGWDQEGLRNIARFAVQQNLPVAASFRRQDLFDNRHPNYVGEIGIGVNPALARLVGEADLLISVGSRLGEMVTSGYTLLDIPRPRQKLVHVMPAPEELGRVYQTDVKIAATLNAFARAAAQLSPAGGEAWREWHKQARDNYLAYIEPPARTTQFDAGMAVKDMQRILNQDAILTNGAGNYTAWAHRYYQFSQPRSQLAPTSGAMGYGVPAAIAAKLCFPARQVVCLGGDGCFLMTSQELATAVRHRLGIVFLVFNNGMYATIRMHQEKNYPGRVIATDLNNPDFVAYAKSFGVDAVSIHQTEAFAPALEKALATASSTSLPYLIELVLDQEMLTPRATLSGLRKTALAERMDAQEGTAK
ncbi:MULTISPECIES: thiamine pyrophosphate-binding protein [unclassified Herbaspirillum]|uniref:thiamine pyrophosphate-binding protein n=1 Tax=unclassified Herbaspirillum TaxID=2624150 RepID=UPI001153A09F|nr:MULTISPECIES: thiamine pyrophosphate-binding protein [unclassified Herbaspirillum]MBB5390743.1 acetolactate synthase-1/2/3 large subunit [Herbaspirillum sp. SJZ102]TQK08773.1 acetolactate synthase large subunit [Herbaspirillum sp. SJZ130]TQK14540.1 acetolactate synthase large subunit [Herbaspirillum sp. SJZ106]